MRFNAVAVAALFSAGCGIFTADIDSARNKGPFSISMIEGNGQAAVIGQRLSHPLTVKVINREGQPVAEIPVLFSLQEGSATLEESVVLTAGSGQAAALLTLGDRPGAVTVVATAEGAVDGDGQPRTAVFQLQALTGAAQQLLKNSGDNQEARAGAILPFPLTVQLLDIAGNGIPGADIQFAPPQLVGIGQGSKKTDQHGQAAIVVTAATQADAYQITASAQGLTTFFTYRALPDNTALVPPAFLGPPAYTAYSLCNDNTVKYEPGKPLAKPVAVLVEDVYHNPVPDQVVSFSVNNSGQVSPPQVYTAKNGIAFTAVTMGNGGSNTVVTAQVTGVTPQPCALTPTS